MPNSHPHTVLDLVTFLRRTFGEGEFHVQRTGEQFKILLPRPLSDKEQDELYRSRLTRAELSSDPYSTLDRGTLERESLTPMVRSHNQNTFKLPSEENSKDLSLIYSISKVDLSRQGVASSLYMTHI